MHRTGYRKNYSRSTGFGGYGRKNRFSTPKPASSKRGHRDVYIDENKYISKHIESTQELIYDNAQSFSDFSLHSQLKANIASRNFAHPTKIQAKVIKPLLEKMDVLGTARTGSGKTAAFLIPAINNCLNNAQSRCLVVVPTRELAAQIQAECRVFARNTPVTDAVVIGGASYLAQMRALRSSPRFVIATPGRLLDLAGSAHVNLGAFDTVILDEVDTMLDMGFIHSIKLIISQLKTPRQSMFFSATLSQKAKELASAMLSNPVIVETDAQESIKNVYQDVVRVSPSSNKLDTLHKLLADANANEAPQKVLIFSRTKYGADKLVNAMRGKGHKCDSLHGNKSLSNRTKVLSMFKRSEINILVATDVASRGIDVPDISHVINFDKPATYEDYIHRIGRTGRIGKTGTALTFV